MGAKVLFINFNHKISLRHIQFGLLILRGQPGVLVQVVDSLLLVCDNGKLDIELARSWRFLAFQFSEFT